MCTAKLYLLSFFAGLSVAQYTLVDHYDSTNFFSGFGFYTGGDPTNGYVTFVDQGTAQSTGLINTNNNQVYIGVDHTNVASGSGRASVRLTGNKQYNHGLFILDLAHMPGGICGTWPAFWLLGPNWPNSGEIDIFEGVNENTNNAMTLHTSDGCTITNDNAFTGTLTTTNCYVNAPGQSTNAGCDIQDQRTNSYGANFNAQGGGVFATQWTSGDINIWFFAPGTVPADINNQNPAPQNWGPPVAQFQGGCNIDSHFQNLQIIFDNTFCGDWAGNTFSASAHCASIAPSCVSYVQNNPSAFTEAYWLVNSLRVYEGQNPASAVGAHDFVVGGKNETAPLGASVPLAMGGGLKGPPARGGRGW